MLPTIASRIVDSCVDLSWTVIARPFGSIPRDKNVNLPAPSMPPEVISAEKAPVESDLKLPEARSLPGRGGFTKAEGDAGEFKLLLHAGTQGDGAEVGGGGRFFGFFYKGDRCRRVVVR